MYEGSRRFPWGRERMGIEAGAGMDSSGVKGEAGGEETKDDEGCKLISWVAEDAEVKESGVFPERNVGVGLGLSISGGMSLPLQRVKRVKYR